MKLSGDFTKHLEDLIIKCSKTEETDNERVLKSNEFRRLFAIVVMDKFKGTIESAIERNFRHKFWPVKTYLDPRDFKSLEWYAKLFELGDSSLLLGSDNKSSMNMYDEISKALHVIDVENKDIPFLKLDQSYCSVSHKPSTHLGITVYKDARGKQSYGLTQGEMQEYRIKRDKKCEKRQHKEEWSSPNSFCENQEDAEYLQCAMNYLDHQEMFWEDCFPTENYNCMDHFREGKE